MAALVELKCLDCERSTPDNNLSRFLRHGLVYCSTCDDTGVVSHTDIYIDSLPEAAIEYGGRLVGCKLLTENEKES